MPNLRRVTTKLLDDAHEVLPQNGDNQGWWEDRHIDYDELIAYLRKQVEATGRAGRFFDPAAWLGVGVMIGFELGKAASDPSFWLAREMEDT